MLLIVIITVALNVNSQSTVLPVTLKPTSFIYSYTGTVADTVSVNLTNWTRTVLLNKKAGVYFNAAIKLADVTAGAKAKVVLYGKVFNEDPFTAIDSLTWNGGGTDTVLVFTKTTNKTYYRYLKFNAKYVANKAKVSYINLSIKE